VQPLEPLEELVVVVEVVGVVFVLLLLGDVVVVVVVVVVETGSDKLDSGTRVIQMFSLSSLYTTSSSLPATVA